MRPVLVHPPSVPEEPASGKRRLAAIVHAGVVGFSRLTGEDEAGTHRTLGELRRAVDPLIAVHRGRIVGTAGDSLLADFVSVVDAVGCAVAMQNAARGVNDPRPPERRLELRIGVNLGDVIVDGDDIFGDGVNIAARPSSSGGRSWRPPMQSWISSRMPSASGARRCMCRRFSTPAGLPGNSAPRRRVTACSKAPKGGVSLTPKL
jgi:hypothetical protein